MTIQVFYMGTCTGLFGLQAHYLMAVTNLAIYHIKQFSLLLYYGIMVYMGRLNFDSTSTRGSCKKLQDSFCTVITSKYIDQSSQKLTCIYRQSSINIQQSLMILWQLLFKLFQRPSSTPMIYPSQAITLNNHL